MLAVGNNSSQCIDQIIPSLQSESLPMTKGTTGIKCYTFIKVSGLTRDGIKKEWTLKLKQQRPRYPDFKSIIWVKLQKKIHLP